MTRPPVRAATGAPGAPDGWTVGVEEEFLLIDPETRTPAPAGPLLHRAAAPDWEVDVHLEFSPMQIEMATRVCGTLGELHDQLVLGRERLAGAARRAGYRVIASGTTPLGDPGPPPVNDSPRYLSMLRGYGPLAEGQGVCGCHVHVGVPDRERAVQVCNHLRPWLPVLLGLTTNSPFSQGRDTGHASWRAVVWSRWPICGVPPHFRSLRDYQELIDRLVASGVIVDERMVYWFARPSSHLPTVEIRVADVAATAEEATLLAGLVRALVMRAEADIDAGVPAPSIPDYLARAAAWRAARDGLEGRGIDLHTGELVGAWELVRRLMQHVRPALALSGDLPVVHQGLRRLRQQGSAAARQRAAYRRRGDLRDVVDFLSRQTTSDAPAVARRDEEVTPGLG